MNSRLIRKQNNTAGPDIYIISIQGVCIKWTEIVRNGKSSTARGEFDNAVAQLQRRGLTKFSVSGRDIQITRCIRRNSRTTRPQTATVPVRCRGVYAFLLQTLLIVSKKPSVEWPNFAMGSKSNIYQPIRKQQSRTTELMKRIKRQVAAGTSIARAWHRRINHSRTGRLFIAGENVQDVQTVEKRIPESRLRFYVQAPACHINDWCACNADEWANVLTIESRGILHRGFAGLGPVSRVNKVCLPQRRGIRTGIVISIERVNRVRFCRYEHNIMNTPAGNGKIRHIKRLRKNISIDRHGEQLSKLVGIYVRGRQNIDLCRG